MISFSRVVIFLLLVCISFYTISYGSWTWNKKNKLGAIAVFLIAILSLALPVFIAFYIR